MEELCQNCGVGEEELRYKIPHGYCIDCEEALDKDADREMIGDDADFLENVGCK